MPRMRGIGEITDIIAPVAERRNSAKTTRHGRQGLEHWSWNRRNACATASPARAGTCWTQSRPDRHLIPWVSPWLRWQAVTEANGGANGGRIYISTIIGLTTGARLRGRDGAVELEW